MYLDPGFGSMIIQGIVALIAAFGAYLIIIRKKVFAFFKGRKAQKDPEDMQQAEQQE